jgi:hypothetical protein
MDSGCGKGLASGVQGLGGEASKAGLYAKNTKNPMNLTKTGRTAGRIGTRTHRVIYDAGFAIYERMLRVEAADHSHGLVRAMFARFELI